MIYILFGTAIILGFCFKKSKPVTLYMLLVMYILAVFKSNVPDLGNYQLEFLYAANHVWRDTRYLGYFWLVTVCAEHGMSFLTFSMLYYGVCLSVLLIAIKRMTKFPNIVLTLYMIYPFAMEAIQMKTMMANAWILLGLSFLFDFNNKSKHPLWRLILFLLFSLIGCSFHYSLVIFIVIGLMYFYLPNAKFTKYILIASISMFALIYFNILPGIVNAVLTYVPGDIKYTMRWLTRNVKMGFVFPMVAILLISLVVFLKKKIAKKEPQGLVFVQSVWCVLPLFLYDITFFRLIRVYLILLYFMFAEEGKLQYSFSGGRKSYRMSYDKFGFIVLFIILITYSLYYEMSGTNIFLDLLRYNTLL